MERSVPPRTASGFTGFFSFSKSSTPVSVERYSVKVSLTSSPALKFVLSAERDRVVERKREYHEHLAELRERAWDFRNKLL
jgi:hypothetical protein